MHDNNITSLQKPTAKNDTIKQRVRRDLAVNSERKKRSPKELADFVEIKSLLQNKNEVQAESRISNLNNLNYRDNDGKTILHYACEYECEDVVQFLVESYYSSVDFDVLDNEGNTPLMIAASKNHNKIAIMLVENGNVDVNKQLLEDKQEKRIYRSKTALSIAVENKNLEVIKAIMSKRNVNLGLKINANRVTVLHLIARGKTSENIEIAEILLTKEAVKTLKLNDKHSLTPLHTAVKHDNLEVVELFVKQFPDLIEKEEILRIKEDRDDKNAPLHDAIKHKNVEIFKLLLTVATKEDLAIKNKKGETPYELAKAKVDHIASNVNIDNITDDDVNNQDFNNDTKRTLKILQIMQQKQRELGIRQEVVPVDAKSPENYPSYKTLLKNIQDPQKGDATEEIKKVINQGYDINLLDTNGKAILHYACESLSPGIVLSLLEIGADPNLVDGTKDTPLIIVASQFKKGNFEVLDAALINYFLIGEGADVNKQNYNLETALSTAIEAKNFLVAQELINTKEVDLKLKINASRATVLHLIARDKTSENIKIAKILLTKEAVKTLKFLDSNSLTPLHVAVKNDNLEVVKLFIERFPDLIKKERILQIKENRYGRHTLLHDAIKHKNVEIFKLLLTVATKEDLAIKNKKGETPISLIDKIENVTIRDQMRAAYSDFLLRDNIEIMDVDNQQPAVEGDANVQEQSLGDRICDAIESRDEKTLEALLPQLTKGDLFFDSSDKRSIVESLKEILKVDEEEERRRKNTEINDRILDMVRNRVNYLCNEVELDAQSAIDQQEAGPSSMGANACLPSAAKRSRLEKRSLKVRVKRKVKDSKCLLAENEEGKVNEEKTGIEINEDNLAESKIDKEKLKVYQEDLNNRLDTAATENTQNSIKKEQKQLNKLILKIQQAQTIRSFYMLSKEALSQEFNDKLQGVIERVSGEPESLQYFKQIIKINLLRTVLPLIKDEKFKGLLLNSPEKFDQDQGLLNNIFAEVEETISEEYEGKQKLAYEDFENIENRINEQISNVENLTNQDVNKSHLLNYVLMSTGLSGLLSDADVSVDLRNKMQYETLSTLGALIADHESHIKAAHHGHEHNPHMDALKSRIRGNELLSVAHDLYYLRGSGDNIDQSKLYSKVVKDKVSSYGNINDEYVVSDLLNQFSSEEIENIFNEKNIMGFGAELEAYEKEVITIHSKQVQAQASHAAIQIGIKDISGNDKSIVIDSIEDIKNSNSFSVNEANFAIQLKLRDKSYIITSELEGESTKFYLNIGGYKAKIGDLISSFTVEEKNNIHNHLHKLQEKADLLSSRKDIYNAATIDDASFEKLDNIINEIKQEFLRQGVRENTWEQFNEQIENLSQEIYAKYIGEMGENLAKNNVGFDRNKFNLAKIKGAKGGKLMSVLAIYDLFDSTVDLKGLGDSPLNTIFGINGLLDAMDDVRESLSTQYMRSDGKIKTKLSRNGLGKITSKIPANVRKGFVRMINNPVVQGITFATIAYQFGYSIDAITKGENVELNSYFVASSGIKLASMSVKPISMGVMAATRGLSTLRAISIVSKVLSKLSIVTAVVDIVVTIGIEIHEAQKYVKATASQVPLSELEKIDLFLKKAPLLDNFLSQGLSLRNIEEFVCKIDNDAFSSCKRNYERDIRLKQYLDLIEEEAVNWLNRDPNVAAVVRYITTVESRYSKIAKIQEKRVLPTGRAIPDDGCKIVDKIRLVAYQRCFDYKNNSLTAHYHVDSNVQNNLFSLYVSNILDLQKYTLPSNDNEVYIINEHYKYLPFLNSSEYNSGKVRFVDVPLGDIRSQTECDDEDKIPIYVKKVCMAEDFASNRLRRLPECDDTRSRTLFNLGAIKNCMDTFTIEGNKIKPFIFTKLNNNRNGKVVYLPGPKKLTAAANYPAEMYLPRDHDYGYEPHKSCYVHNGRHVWKGSRSHQSTFIINHIDTTGHVIGGKAVAEKNALVLSFNGIDNVNVLLNVGSIYYDMGICTPKIIYEVEVTGPAVQLTNIYNYVSNTTAQQDVITHCKTRYVNAGGGNKGNTIRQGAANCQNKDHEVRVVHKNDVHYRGSKQTTLIVDKSISSATVSSNFDANKNNTDVIKLNDVGIEWLRIREGENNYNLALLAGDRQTTNIKVDNLKNLAIVTNENQTIIIQDKSADDLVRDMVYQKLNHSGGYVDNRILEDSKTKSKAIILQNVDDAGVAEVASNVAKKSRNLGLPAQIIVTKYREKELIERAVMHDTSSKDVYVDLFALGEFKLGYSYSSIESIKTKDENITIFSFLNGYNVHLNRNGHDITSYVFSEQRSISEVIADGDYQDVAGELNTTIPIKFGDEIMIIGTKNDANLNAEDDDGNTALHLACKNCNYDVVRYFVEEKNARINVKNKDGKTSLDLANECGQSEKRNSIIDLFKQAQLKLNEQLLSAARNGDLKKVRSLVSKGADLDARANRYGETPLHLAAENGYLNIVRYLKNKGANLEATSWHGSTPLHYAAESGHLSVVKYLKDEGANLETTNRGNSTPLHYAAQNNCLSIVEYLVACGVDINAENNNGETPLGLLKKHNVDTNVIEDLKKRHQLYLDKQLLIAAEKDDFNQVKNLHKKGANVNAKDNNGYTSLHFAAWSGYKEIAQYLIDNGTEIDINNNDGKTPLDLAKERGHSSVVEILKLQLDLNRRHRRVHHHKNSKLRHYRSIEIENVIDENSKVEEVVDDIREIPAASSSGIRPLSILGTVDGAIAWGIGNIKGAINWLLSKETTNSPAGIGINVSVQDRTLNKQSSRRQQARYLNSSPKIAAAPNFGQTILKIRNKNLQHNNSSKTLESNNRKQQESYDTRQSIPLEQFDPNSTLFLVDAIVRSKTKEHYKQQVDDSLLPPIEQSRKLNLSDSRLKLVENALENNITLPSSEEQIEGAKMWIAKADSLKKQQSTSNKPATGLNNISIIGNTTVHSL